MTSINPSALVAAQVYGAASQPQRQPAAEQQKPAQTPRFHVEDQVTLRSAGTAKAATATSSGPPAQERDQAPPSKPRRPGALVDLKV